MEEFIMTEIKNQVEVVAEGTKAPWEEQDQMMAKYGYKKALLTLGQDVTFHECNTEKSKTNVRARIRANVYYSDTHEHEWVTLFAYPQSDKGINRLNGFKKGMRLTGYVKVNNRSTYTNAKGEEVPNATGTVSLTGLFERPFKKAKAKADAQA